MQYRALGHSGVYVSSLGLGMMRLPLNDGSQGFTGVSSGRVNVDASVTMLRRAVDLGVNYVDTAYNYLDGDSERITGLALLDGYREKVLLATKAPTWLFKAPEDFDRYLDEQMERIGTDYIDVYLLHGMNRVSWSKTVLRHDILRKAEQAKAAGKIRFLGFSFHDDLDAFHSIVDYYDDWDLCQIQLNYLDTDFQAGLQGLEYAASHGLGVSIMEPLRGGYLARVPTDVRDIFASVRPERSPVEWALDFLWDRPEVGVVLSGMGSVTQVEENVGYADRARPGMLTQMSKAVFDTVRAKLAAYPVIPCTGCAYCMHCPKRVAIPYNFLAYNEYQTTGDLERARQYYKVQITPFGATAGACIACGKCEEICPQHIPISQWMPRIALLFGGTAESV